MSLLRTFRSKQNWTQAELARRSGVTRSSIAAIETGALVPSVHSAIALARCLDCTVEELFDDQTDNPAKWAWEPEQSKRGYWKSAFGPEMLAFPVEPLPFSVLPPDGWHDGQSMTPMAHQNPELTLIIASCDPAAGFLAAMMREKEGIRMLPFYRSSNEALALLKQGVVHVAGMHLREIDENEGNPVVAREFLGKGYRFLRGAVWQEGVAVRAGEGVTTFRKAASSRIRWIGRKPGTGARRCQDKVIPAEKAPEQVAQNHWEVAMAVRHGWIDAGICHGLAAAHANLELLPASREAFDFCYPVGLENDPRIRALRKVVKSTDYRKGLGAFTGIDSQSTGEEEGI